MLQKLEKTVAKTDSIINKYLLAIRTLAHLKFIQIFYQIKVRVTQPRTIFDYRPSRNPMDICSLSFSCHPPSCSTWEPENSFSFLNKKVKFGKEIDWNFLAYGKLWNYNLQYAHYLHQPDLSSDEKASLMRDQYAWLADGRLPLEPYPASLRTMNMIRWLSTNEIQNYNLIDSLYADISFLSTRVEYHLLGNHLLENAFALMMGGVFFSNESWLRKGKKILKRELIEQVLPDGAHFELSPMYHQIIFFRVLELLDWYSTRPRKDMAFEALLRQKAADMRDWLTNITFSNGDIPHFNDSANGIAYPSSWLCHYADLLGVEGGGKPLKESGYRSITGESYELKIDFAQIGPSYQPGHAHADALSFILYYNGEPLFVEQGTSTYERGVRRKLERSTKAHNTVVVSETDQSQVWGQFRVGRRAKTTILQDNVAGVFVAKHDGYRQKGVTHKRAFKPRSHDVLIEDDLSKPADSISYYHLHPNVKIVQSKENVLYLDNEVSISFEGNTSIWTEAFEFAQGFNMCVPSTRICVSFNQHLTTLISFGQRGFN